MKMFINNKKKLILILFIFSVLFADEKNQIKIVSNNTNSKFLNRNNFYNNTYLQLSLNYEKSGNVFTLYPSISNSSLSIDQFIFSKKIKKTDFKIGKFNLDCKYSHELSSGHLINSGYSLPYFKLMFERDFKLPFNSYITYQQSEGIFEKNSLYIEAPYVHQKSLYFNKIFNTSLLSTGLSHVVTWAGTTERHGKLPRSLDDYHNIFTGQKGSETAPKADQGNSLGDGWGIWDFNYIYKNNIDTTLGFYYQHIFNDRSGLEFKNGKDGLWGGFIEKEVFGKKYVVLVEYLDTTDQSGNYHPPGGDSYYWNGMYSHGWKYNERIIGNPFIDVFSNRIKLTHFASSIDLNNSSKIIFTKSQSRVFKSYNNKDYTQIIKDSNGFLYSFGADSEIERYNEENISFFKKINEQYSINVSISNVNNQIGSYFSINFIF
tara:strand:- start:4190 stop:5485 length:1296 start_codon:yes stop_codon:yes gene_type:complete